MALQNGKFVRTSDVVVSGISGVFPGCGDMQELQENLLSGVNFIPETSAQDSGNSNEFQRIAIIKNLDRFDHSFFHISRSQAEATSVSGRIILEKVFEAILDAGYNPQQFRGTNTGIFLGICNDEKENTINNVSKKDEYTNLTNLRCMLPNRISYSLDLHGPSVLLDAACSSGIYALDAAYKAIQNGSCDAAVVCTLNLCLSSAEGDALNNIGAVSRTGRSRPFDAEADGYVRGEAIVATLLQKKEHARRAYANLVYTKTNCDGYTPDGAFYPSCEAQKDLFQKFYQEIDVDPQSVSYIEAHGTGTKVGDIVEVNAIDRVFCRGKRRTPLYIGSLRSNQGHTEASSALCSLAKMIIAFETGIIPPTINLKNPNPKIEPLHNGNINVITKPTTLEGEYFAINSFGIGGSNGHVLLTPNAKNAKNKSSLDSIDENMPLLVTVSGRTEEAVNAILNDVEKNIEDIEYIALWHEIFNTNIRGHNHRGYILSSKGNLAERNTKEIINESRPIWFVFVGMGSQWPTMGKSLMSIPIFAESIRKSHRILEVKGINLIHIITDDDPAIFNNVLNSFVGIAAIQIALVDLLKAVGIEPDGIIGHSVGELGCAYVDDCLTAEQVLMAAYYRGVASLESKLVNGTLAAVGMGYNDIKDLVPPEIDVAAHNSPTSCTVSGPTHIVKEFMEELKQKNIFVREVNSSNIPYHSRYITAAGDKLITYMENVIPEPKPRSRKWICTSVPVNGWGANEAKFASARYFTNNLLNPVYFEEGSRYIPDNAVTVEIAPHALLQAILKRSLPPTVDNIPLTSKNYKDGVKFLFNALGQIYLAGGTPRLNKLYPLVEFPVSRKTPMISPLIKWFHEDVWPVKRDAKKITSGERDVMIHLKDHEYLRGHVIDGRNLFPATGYLYLVWETVAAMQKKKLEATSIVFENVRFQRATNIKNTQAAVNFHISVQIGTGHFEITESDGVVAVGLVRIPENIESEKLNVSPLTDYAHNSDALLLKTKDFYKILRLRGYHYKGLFKKVQYASSNGAYGKVSWCGNFVSFMDTIAQVGILQKDIDQLIIPTFIRKIVIDLEKHTEILATLDKQNPEFPININPRLSLSTCGGIQMIGLKGSVITRKKEQSSLVLEKNQFVPYISCQEMDFNTAIRMCVHIVLENMPTINVKTLEILRENYDSKIPPISNLISSVLGDLPMVHADLSITSVSKSQQILIPENFSDASVKVIDKLPHDNSYLMIIIENISSKTEHLENIFLALQNNGFLITKEPITSDAIYQNFGLNICFSRPVNGKERILLLNKITENKSNSVPIKVENTSYSWIPKLQENLTTSELTNDEKLIVYSEKEPLSGILGFFNCLRKEEKSSNLRCFFIMDKEAPSFSLQRSLYKTQFMKNLSHNVYKNGEWGSYRHLQLEPVQDMKVNHAYVTQHTLGDFSTFRWVQGASNPHNSSDTIPIHVYYSALNFRDIMIGTGKLTAAELFRYNRFFGNEIGFECSGRDVNGRRCTAILQGRGISTFAEADPRHTWRVPDHMTLEEASTIPLVYGTVVRAFFYKMNLQKGCTVLIHSGSGGVGQAAINICMHYKCEIFTTVGNSKKVEYIRRKFPQIPEDHIGNSRDMSFEKMIMERTNGRGVDVVLNSLSDEQLLASIRCVAKGGHFIEIGRFDIINHKLMDMGPFINSISFHSLQLDDADAQTVQSLTDWNKKMQHLLDEGIIKPIDRTVFERDDVESAIRCMAAGKHLGKVVIKIRDEEQEIHATPSPLHLKAAPRFYCDENKSYLIIGGLGGFGLELTDWLVGRGAKKVLLSSRAGLQNGYQTYKIQSWRSYGVHVVISTEDVSVEAGVENLLRTAISLGPVGAIFNVAVILEDCPFSQQTEEKFQTSAGPKAVATLHLDRLSRQMCPHLEHFVVFSSVSCGRGNIDQTNYGMSNSVMERVCETRRADNLPALAIQWGAIGEVGVVADLAEDNLTVVIGGTLQQKVNSCLETLNAFMHQSNPIVSSMIVAEKRSSNTDVIVHIANILGINDLKSISLTWTLPELGMDSITSAELKQIIEAEFGVFLTLQDMKNMTFGKLYDMKEEQSSKPDGQGNKMTQIQSLFVDESVNLPFVRLPFNQKKLDEEIPLSDSPTIFVFPGIEGAAKVIEPLAKNLNSQVLCFQYLSDDIPKMDLKVIGNYFTQFITDRLDADQEFRIIGYSFGTAFALEVANILERQGRTGRVWCIDGSPDYLKQILPAKYSANSVKLDDVSLECYVCSHVINVLMPGLAHDDLFKQLREAENWESRKNICFSILPKDLWGKAPIHKLFDKSVERIKQAISHEYNLELCNTPCTLIRRSENLYGLDETYGLSKYFKKLVRVHKIENVDHLEILSDIKTAQIIMNDDLW